MKKHWMDKALGILALIFGISFLYLGIWKDTLIFVGTGLWCTITGGSILE